MAAKGGVFNSASLSAYSGRIVSSPTLFAFARGAGLMGEAGPEAIMPLRRGADGRLGVDAAGGQDLKLTIVNNTSAPIGRVTERRISATERALVIEEARDMVAAELGDPNSRMSRAMGRSYDTRRRR
jgi:phage-related minor tail protein